MLERRRTFSQSPRLRIASDAAPLKTDSVSHDIFEAGSEILLSVGVYTL